MVRTALTVAALAVVASCAGSPPAQPGRPGTGQATDLVGLWRVEAAGEEPGTVLRLGSDLSIWRRCGELFGGWVADAEGGFVGDTQAYTEECATATSTVKTTATSKPKPEVEIPPTPEWLTRAVAYRADGVDRLLLDGSGTSVARLRPGGEPSHRTVVSHDLYAQPTIDPTLRQRLSPAAPLPVSLRPATRTDLVGTWKPAVPGNARQYVRLRDDGSWDGSDGCNSTGGRWTLTRPGVLLTVSGPSTLVGCAGQGKEPDVGTARGAGFDGATLVLTDAQGHEVGRLTR